MLQHNSSFEEPLICNQRNGERGSSRPPALRANCDAGSPSVSISDSDLMITPAHQGNTASLEATPGAGSCRPRDLHSANHVNMSRRGESPLSSRMIFTSSSASGDHERGFAVAGAWSPRCYACSFCGREFKSAQALGGHMNIHRRDRARLCTATSLPSVPRHADLPPAHQNTPESGQSTLYLPFEAACRDNPTSISSSLNTYQPPTIISAAPAFKLLDMRSAADPALLATVALPNHDDKSSASFSVPISDLVSFRFGSTRSPPATRFSQIQNRAHSLFPNIAPHASSLLTQPMLENASFKPAEAVNVCAGEASTRQFRLDCCGAKAADGYTAPQRIQFSQAKGRNKRARGSVLDAVKISSEDKSRVQRCAERPSTTENSNSLHDVYNDIKELSSLDLELRLGQSSPAPASNLCVRSTARLPP